MKKTGGAKGALLLVVRERAVAPLFAHVSGAVLTWVTPFVTGRGALLAQHREKL